MRRAILLICFAAALHAQTAVDFQRDIRPILNKKCIACHGADERGRMANLRLDTHDGATGNSGGYKGIVPGNSAASRVVARITDEKRPMPPSGPRLSATEVSLIRRWIDAGAPYTNHWAFEKPRIKGEPQGNAIDYYVKVRLDQAGLSFSPEADKHTLARRVALDLTGLPPSKEILAAYLADSSEKAYESLVDKLLSQPRYGERWAKIWLDLARYADTQGYEKDNNRTIWPYRDWVIQAFNENMPYDRFTIEQMAGDLLPNPSQSQLIATGFHRNTMTNTEGGTDDEEFRDAAVKDRIAVSGQVWMGLTAGCAQCHTHKYDPITHKEFYQLYAFLNQTEDKDLPSDVPVLKLANDVSTLVMKDLPPDKQRKTRIHDRGNFLNPTDEVQPGVPAAFHPLPAGAPRNRLGFAQWLVSKENPLTARVAANRFWARMFGRGIVETEEDFGTQGATPSHPELLDWLAVEFMRTDWNVKQLLKTIAMSRTYRQASNVTPALLEKDPDNRLLARGARFRLDAEVVRDQALASAGMLSGKMYGKPVMPWQPDGIWLVVYNGDRWITSPGEDRYRRSLYTYMRRTSPYPSMSNYDAPTGEVCTVRRIRTNTPLQALTALNDPVFFEAAQKLALRTLSEAGGNDRDRADRLFRNVMVRPPSKEELQRIVKLHRETRDELKRNAASSQRLLHYDQTLYVEDREVTLVGDARKSPADWRYTTEDPGVDWLSASFDTSSWKTGKGMFGFLTVKEQQKDIITAWETDHIWMRYDFEMTAQTLENFRMYAKNTSGFEIFLNGVPAVSSIQDRGSYYEYRVAPQAIQALKPGRNTIAVKATRTYGMGKNQSIDVGFVAARPPDYSPQTKDLADRAAWVAVANAILNLDETVTRR
ncbi:MAG: PSD1 domain-containing protein [Bryobacterales bacterium]|nr:PSD1 domain-containing protein [Bryobacterales bacterium]